MAGSLRLNRKPDVLAARQFNVQAQRAARQLNVQAQRAAHRFHVATNYSGIIGPDIKKRYEWVLRAFLKNPKNRNTLL